MALLVIRLFGLGASLIAAAVVYLNWQELLRDGTYSLRAAGAGPMFIVYGLFVMLFPTLAKPETKFDKFMAFFALLLGAAAGIYNWYLMDPAKFSWLIK